MNYVYLIHDKTNLSITCYIGVTANIIEQRLKWHIDEAKYSKKDNHRLRWLRKLLKHDVHPDIILLETFDDDNEWDERERFWISYYKSIGMKLCNKTDGGKGKRGSKHSNESKRKIAERARGRHVSRETRDKIAKGLIGNTNRKGILHDNRVKSIISNIHKGKPKSKEQKDKMAIGARKRWQKQGTECISRENNVHYNHNVKDNDLKTLFKAGLTRAEIAKHLECSWSIVDKRLKKLGLLK